MHRLPVSATSTLMLAGLCTVTSAASGLGAHSTESMRELVHSLREVPKESAGDSTWTVHFVATFNGTTLRCGQSVGSTDFQLNQLKFFVHAARLVTTAGEELPAQSDVALLDLVGATTACNDRESLDVLSIKLDRSVRSPANTRSEVVGIAFRLGVPFGLNHADPDAQELPLADPSMDWGWMAGHKFLRAEAIRGNRPVRLHLGSVGCHGTVGHISSCDFQNRPEIRLIRGEDLSRSQVTRSPLSFVVRVELDKLLDDAPGVFLGPRSCMGRPDDLACASSLKALGLDGSGGGDAFSLE